MLKLYKLGQFLNGCQCQWLFFIIHQLEKKIFLKVSLYRYNCGVNSAIILYIERFLKLFITVIILGVN